MVENVMEKLVALCKRRGFIFPGSEIYGGLNGTWDLGPMGVAFANNIKNEWWKSMVLSREDIVGLDSSIIHHPDTWVASGHVASFTDPLVECKVCHDRFRSDHEKIIKDHQASHKEKNIWTEVKQFNLMFKTYVGPIDDEKNKTYLRPETAQGIFINFKNVLETSRVKVPFGIAQIGKGFRNEITTGNFLFRAREFEMMELEFFVKPGTDKKWHDYWKKQRLQWYLDLGIREENIKLVDLPKEDIAHYSKGTTEVWYNWPFTVSKTPGFAELEGIANRGDYDLLQHAKFVKKEITYFEQETNEHFVPYVIEPSVGLGRAMLAFLLDAYQEEEKRVVLKLHPKLAPIKVAVFPLLGNKDQLIAKAKEIYASLKIACNGAAMFDDRGNIGKRYLYQDEIGTPFCVTVDFQTLEDNTVTIRHRDTTKQERIKAEDVVAFIIDKLK